MCTGNFTSTLHFLFLFLCIIVRQPSRFSVVSEPKESDKSKRPKHRSVREFFGQDEYCYIMDAKNNGNIGRYLNVSLLNNRNIRKYLNVSLLNNHCLRVALLSDCGHTTIDDKVQNNDLTVFILITWVKKSAAVK